MKGTREDLKEVERRLLASLPGRPIRSSSRSRPRRTKTKALSTVHHHRTCTVPPSSRPTRPLCCATASTHTAALLRRGTDPHYSRTDAPGFRSGPCQACLRRGRASPSLTRSPHQSYPPHRLRLARQPHKAHPRDRRARSCEGTSAVFLHTRTCAIRDQKYSL